MGMKKVFNYGLQLATLILLSGFAMAVIGAFAAILTGSYKTVLSYIFR